MTDVLVDISWDVDTATSMTFGYVVDVAVEVTGNDDLPWLCGTSSDAAHDFCFSVPTCVRRVKGGSVTGGEETSSR